LIFKKRGFRAGYWNEKIIVKGGLLFYDRNESARELMGDPVLRALEHELTDKLRKSATVDWSKRQSAREKMRVLVKKLSGKTLATFCKS
jgi:type I site-specific restriction-modification system R (restriction) subunit